MSDDNPHAFRIRPGMWRGLASELPLPTRLVSNEEFPPLPQTRAQREVQARIVAEAGRLAPRLGLSRRAFLHTSRGQIFGLDAARLFGVDVNAQRNELPKDYLSRMKMAYMDEGPVPSHRLYGWVTR